MTRRYEAITANVVIALITGAIGFGAATLWNVALTAQRDEIGLKSVEAQIETLSILVEALKADQNQRNYRRWNLPDQQVWAEELQRRNPKLDIPPPVNNQDNLNDELENRMDGTPD